ncbi:hypothetical protein M513_02066 [Trichuris suis]|uniref:Uncharacterized protein n=1 Tax=Trichuris suis TaxID=68888 RepID=A0A085MIY5_9BILA|nr:hypothetical protein M513_02066 [Trichuris suis]
MKIAFDQYPCIIYEIKCNSSSPYVDEADRILANKFGEHVKWVNRYNNAENENTRHRGRPPKLDTGTATAFRRSSACITMSRSLLPYISPSENPKKSYTLDQ